jgi:hypothetical protein
MLEHSEMLRDRRLRDSRVVGEHPHGLLTITAQTLEKRPPRGIGKRLEKGIGRGTHVN